MKMVNIAQFKNKFSHYMHWVESGDEIAVCRRNIAVARISPVAGSHHKNRTKLGCGVGTAIIKGDLTGPLIPESSWGMLEADKGGV